MNYSTFICSFECGKCEKEEEKLQKFEYLENEKSFLDKIKNIFSQFLKGHHLRVLIRKSTVFIYKLKMKIRKRLVRPFDSTCMRCKLHIAITSKSITHFSEKSALFATIPVNVQ